MKCSYKVILTALLLIQAVLLIHLSWSTSPNRTEISHIGATVYFLNTGKIDVFTVNPPLVRIVAGIPLVLFCKPIYDLSGCSASQLVRSEWKLGNDFIEANEFENLRFYVFITRMFCIPYVLIGGYVGFRFTSELYCERSCIIFLILWTFSPYILGWGATICPDVAAASMGIVGLYFLWNWLKNPKWDKAIIAGICLGPMSLTKLTWIIVFPLWIVIGGILFFRCKREIILSIAEQLFTIIFLGISTINAGYFFDGSPQQLGTYRFYSTTLSGKQLSDSRVIPDNRFANSIFCYTPVPLPKDFVNGIDTQKFDFDCGMDSYARSMIESRLVVVLRICFVS
ncbi:MAG: hypothetical protein LBU65_16005 [Planctomycetaceae bacterium]|jgi:hypothetical protein|nr:hypothetical protein [Planctomycetaceae bacterium]